MCRYSRSDIAGRPTNRMLSQQRVLRKHYPRPSEPEPQVKRVGKWLAHGADKSNGTSLSSARSMKLQQTHLSQNGFFAVSLYPHESLS